MTTATKASPEYDTESAVPEKAVSAEMEKTASCATKRNILLLTSLGVVLLLCGAIAVVLPITLAESAPPLTTTVVTTVTVDLRLTVPASLDRTVHATLDVPSDGLSSWHLVTKKDTGGCAHVLFTGGVRYTFTSASCSVAPTDAKECTIRQLDIPTDSNSDVTAANLLSGLNYTAATNFPMSSPFTPPTFCTPGDESDEMSSPGSGDALVSLDPADNEAASLHASLRADLSSMAAHSAEVVEPEAVIQGDRLWASDYYDYYPWLVYLSTGCGGTLITSQWVLTAAHCMPNKIENLKVKVGMFNKRWKSCDEAGDRSDQCTGVRAAEQIIIHPGYTAANNWQHDIALVKLDTPVDGRLAIHFLDENERPAAQTRVNVAGWGEKDEFSSYPKTPHQVDTYIESCPEYEALGDVCAHGPQGEDACHGDSGGPLVLRDDQGRATIVGLVANGWHCSVKPGEARTGYYTGVAFHLQWIRSKVFLELRWKPVWRIFEVVSGGSSCKVINDGMCVTDGMRHYHNNEDCEIRAKGSLTVRATTFNTEKHYDYISLGGTKYSGRDGPMDVSMAHGEIMRWKSDYSVKKGGWTLCAS